MCHSLCCFTTITCGANRCSPALLNPIYRWKRHWRWQRKSTWWRTGLYWVCCSSSRPCPPLYLVCVERQNFQNLCEVFKKKFWKCFAWICKLVNLQISKSVYRSSYVETVSGTVRFRVAQLMRPHLPSRQDITRSRLSFRSIFGSTHQRSSNQCSPQNSISMLGMGPLNYHVQNLTFPHNLLCKEHKIQCGRSQNYPFSLE